MKFSTAANHTRSKSLLIILLMAFNVILLSCGSNTKEPSDGKTEAVSENVTNSHGLSLNSGMRWKSDQSTMANVNAMKLIMENSSPQTIEEFHMTADMMQGSVDKMISECRMTGADHDALHLWLEPLMEKTKELKEGETMDELTLTHDWLDDQVNLFYEYFEE